MWGVACCCAGIASHGGNTRTVAFWGSPRHAVTFFQQLQSMPFLGLRLAAWFEPPNSQPMTLPEAMPPCAGGIREMSEWLSHNAVDQIYFSYASDRNIAMEEVIRFLGDTCKPVYYLPVWSNTSMRFAVEQIGASYCINLWNGEDSILNQQLKRTFDIVFSTIGLLLISPVLLVLAALVKLSSPGPILFKQDRSGIDGKTFKMYKFRTMTVTEDGNTPGLQQARRNDPRVTPIGRILRRWSLDELPQLFNVLEGSMSLVGPRPHAVEHNQQYRKLISGYMQRHLFKPGITGLAQVEGWSGETAQLELMARRVEADLRYLRDWSIALDLKILIKTILRLRSPSAY
jgi:putative colanic acid biosynthesis UDP-glucose lipid carrier transferase